MYVTHTPKCCDKINDGKTLHVKFQIRKGKKFSSITYHNSFMYYLKDKFNLTAQKTKYISVDTN